MEKEIVWTLQAQTDFWEIVSYLKECWPPEVLNRFEKSLLRNLLFCKHTHSLVLKVKNTPGSAGLF